jgi:hypothetical protein
MNMLHKIVTTAYNLLTGTRNPLFYRALFLFLFLSPVILLTIMNYQDLDQDATNSQLAKRRALSVLSAATVRENLDNLINLGISYATRPKVIEFVEKGDWESALSITAQALDLFPYFDRIVFLDTGGLIKADMPHAIPSVIGQSRADREWYKGVKRTWKPYISGVYLRVAEPQTAIISVAVPIQALSSLTTVGNMETRGKQKVIGVLQFQIKLDIFSHWINEVNIGPGGMIYIVDQYGHLVYHPRYVKEKTLTDFSSVGIVAKLMKGIGGSEVNYNPVEKEERLAGYEPISSYGWGVVVTQPTEFAFIEKNKRLHNALITYAIIIFLAGMMALLILYSMVAHRKIESEKEKLIIDLQEALYNIKTLKGLLPICASCKKIRNDSGYWEQMEVYIRDHSEAEFSHGICPDCKQELYGDLLEKKRKNKDAS